MRGTLSVAIATLPLLAACAAGTGEPGAGSPSSAKEDRGPASGAPSVGAIGAVPAEMIEDVLELAASDSGVDPAEVSVITAEAVTWSDGALGCPDDQMYTQALVPGYRVILDVAGEEVAYHASEAGDFFACANPQEPIEDGTVDR